MHLKKMSVLKNQTFDIINEKLEKKKLFEMART